MGAAGAASRPASCSLLLHEAQQPIGLCLVLTTIAIVVGVINRNCDTATKVDAVLLRCCGQIPERPFDAGMVPVTVEPDGA
jgi:hypothetical protein